MPFSDPIVGGTTLVRPAIHSPNYVAGTSGWSINRDGSAEFNNLTARGTVVVGNPPGQVTLDEDGSGNGQLIASGADGSQTAIVTGMVAGATFTPYQSGHSYTPGAISAFVDAIDHKPSVSIIAPYDSSVYHFYSQIALKGASDTSNACTIDLSTQNDSPINSGATVNGISILPTMGNTVVTPNASGDCVISPPYTTLTGFIAWPAVTGSCCVANNNTLWPHTADNTVGVRVWHSDTGAAWTTSTRIHWLAWGIV
jgi:hypothetical protein